MVEKEVKACSSSESNGVKHKYMLCAIETARSGLVSANQAARQHGVPPSTLKDRLSGWIPNGSKPGPRPYMSKIRGIQFRTTKGHSGHLSDDSPLPRAGMTKRHKKTSRNTAFRRHYVHSRGLIVVDNVPFCTNNMLA